MYKTREEFIEALGVTEMPALFGARFEETMAEYEKNGVFFHRYYMKNLSIFIPTPYHTYL